jgi:hypothetical protein
VAAPIESGVAINAAERTDSDCAQEIPLHRPAAMRPKHFGTPAIRTGPFGVRAHISRSVIYSLKSCTDKSGLIAIRAAVSCLRRSVDANPVETISMVLLASGRR